jgi:hypothetical protein
MAAAERVVADGGTVILAAACGDGVPADGPFARILAGAATPDDLASAAGRSEADRWQAQVMGRVLQRARVRLRTDGLTGPEVRDALLDPVEDLSTAVAEALSAAGEGARCCVLPQGPLAVAVAD